jgi:hypothetical protein
MKSADFGINHGDTVGAVARRLKKKKSHGLNTDETHDSTKDRAASIDGTLIHANPH